MEITYNQEGKIVTIEVDVKKAAILNNSTEEEAKRTIYNVLKCITNIHKPSNKIK